MEKLMRHSTVLTQIDVITEKEEKGKTRNKEAVSSLTEHLEDG